MFYINRLMLGTAGRGDNTAAPNHIVFAQEAFGTAQSWTVPEGVYELSMLAIGQGANSVSENRESNSLASGGGAGALRWANNVPVIPGEVLVFRHVVNLTADGLSGYSVFVRRQGSSSSEYLIFADGGNGSWNQNGPKAKGGGIAKFQAMGLVPYPGMEIGEHPTEGFYIGGGDGGDGGIPTGNTIAGGGGGAGGYAGNGGNGARTSAAGTAGAGGAGSGGFGNATAASSGGGTGVNGQGANGAAGTGTGAGGGSGGGGRVACGNNSGGTKAANFGAGAGAYDGTSQYQIGGSGALRFLWGRGKNNGGRAFPSTNVATATT